MRELSLEAGASIELDPGAELVFTANSQATRCEVSTNACCAALRDRSYYDNDANVEKPACVAIKDTEGLPCFWDDLDHTCRQRACYDMVDQTECEDSATGGGLIGCAWDAQLSLCHVAGVPPLCRQFTMAQHGACPQDWCQPSAGVLDCDELDEQTWFCAESAIDENTCAQTGQCVFDRATGDCRLAGCKRVRAPPTSVRLPQCPSSNGELGEFYRLAGGLKLGCSREDGYYGLPSLDNICLRSAGRQPVAWYAAGTVFDRAFRSHLVVVPVESEHTDVPVNLTLPCDGNREDWLMQQTVKPDLSVPAPNAHCPAVWLDRFGLRDRPRLRGRYVFSGTGAAEWVRELGPQHSYVLKLAPENNMGRLDCDQTLPRHGWYIYERLDNQPDQLVLQLHHAVMCQHDCAPGLPEGTQPSAASLANCTKYDSAGNAGEPFSVLTMSPVDNDNIAIPIEITCLPRWWAPKTAQAVQAVRSLSCGQSAQVEFEQVSTVLAQGPPRRQSLSKTPPS